MSSSSNAVKTQQEKSKRTRRSRRQQGVIPVNSSQPSKQMVRVSPSIPRSLVAGRMSDPYTSKWINDCMSLITQADILQEVPCKLPSFVACKATSWRTHATVTMKPVLDSVSNTYSLVGYFAPDPQLPFLAITGNQAASSGTEATASFNLSNDYTERAYPLNGGCAAGVAYYDLTSNSGQFTVQNATFPGTFKMNLSIMSVLGQIAILAPRRDTYGNFYWNTQNTIAASSQVGWQCKFHKTITGASVTMQLQASNDLVVWTSIATQTFPFLSAVTTYSTSINGGALISSNYLRLYYEGAVGVANNDDTEWNQLSMVINSTATASTFYASQTAYNCTPATWATVQNIATAVRVTAAHCNLKFTGATLQNEGTLITAYHETPEGFGSITNPNVISQYADTMTVRAAKGAHLIWTPTKEVDYQFTTLQAKRPLISYFSWCATGLDVTSTLTVDVIICYEAQHSSQTWPLEPVYAAPDMIALLTNLSMDAPRMRENPLHLSEVRDFLAKAGRTVVKVAPYVAKGAAMLAALA